MDDQLDDSMDELEARWAPTLRHSRDSLAQEHAEVDPQGNDLSFGSNSETWEEAVTDANRATDQPHTGVMVAFYPTPEQADQLAVPDGEDPEELHCTLAYLGELGAERDPADEQSVIDAVKEWAGKHGPVDAETSGLGVFHPETSAGDPVTYASIDGPKLPAARQSLIEHLDKHGVPAIQNHGVTPHMTLKYGTKPGHQVPKVKMRFTKATVKFAGNRTDVSLAPSSPPPGATGPSTVTTSPPPPDPESAAAPALPYQQPYGWYYPAPGISTPTTGSPYNVSYNATTNQPMFQLNGQWMPAPAALEAQRFHTSPREMPTDSTPVAFPAIPEQRAFVADVNGKTLITGPARVLAALREPSLDDITAAHMLWMKGAFVGAEVPNRNGALWSAGDLQMAKGTVTNGPLNWLHEGRHIIGTLAKADYVDAQPAATGVSGQGAQKAATFQPHISATAAIWKWIYPDEAFVVQNASDNEMLWYSMECISKQVACAGPQGCGHTASYADYMNGIACDHVAQRASVRHFKEPVFLGGAVIVPPTRPGWAEADARVMKDAAAMAEAAFEQAGQPDMRASDWEQLMAQVINFATR